MRIALAVLVLIAAALPCTPLSAEDVYVRGYYRRDGTYVRPHIRSAPDGYRWNNYGPSTDDSQLLNPWSRDWDSDGTPNYLDYDDDSDGYSDDYDSSQYGWGQ